MQRTLPPRTALTQPWFDACNQGRLLIQRCDACGEAQFYPRIVCSHCGKPDPTWIEASGQAVVASFTVVRHAISKAYEAPYVVALVDLEEGPRLMTHIVDCEPAQLQIGMSVFVRFESWGEDTTLPVFSHGPAA